MKTCTMCKKELDIESFSLTTRYRKKTKDYARESKCKECTREYSRKYKKRYYEKNKELVKARSKKYREDNAQKMKEYWRQYHQDNKEKRLKQAKEYVKTERGRQAQRKSQANYRKRADYNYNQNARKKLFRAVKSGKVIKPDRCENCQRDTFLEGHHEDYSKPLDVVWLCKACHEAVHHLNEGDKSI